MGIRSELPGKYLPEGARLTWISHVVPDFLHFCADRNRARLPRSLDEDGGRHLPGGHEHRGCRDLRPHHGCVTLPPAIGSMRDTDATSQILPSLSHLGYPRIVVTSRALDIV